MSRSLTTPLARYRQLVDVLAALARNSHEIDAVVQVVHEQAGTLFPAQVTLLALLQADGDWLWDLREDDQRFTQHVPFSSECLLERVLYGDPVSVPDIDVYLEHHPVRLRRMERNDVVLLNTPQPGKLPGRPDRSMLFVPLEIDGKRAAVLSLQSYEVDAFDDTDLEFLKVLGQHVAIALENAALREALERLTRTDPLTGLRNRRAFCDDMPEVMEAARRDGGSLSLVMLDVQGFKQINDVHGHQVGDEVLSRVGQILTQGLPASDLAFRLGGDEFALLVWDAAEQLDGLVARLTQALRSADWPPGVGPLCLQGGIAPLQDSGSVDGWLAQADARMYGVKRQRTMGSPMGWGLDFGDCTD